MTSKVHENALILFARDPVLGKVKTRLSPFLKDKEILELYICFLKDSIDKIRQVNGADLFLGIASFDKSGFFRGVQGADIQLFSQQGESLGDRMLQAFQDRFSEGYKRVVIIGSDSPSLPLSYIRQAVHFDKDLVLGPSTDGGYYLIGMREKVVDVFNGVDWGTDLVLLETCHLLLEKGVSLELLPVWYDVDNSRDLKFFKTHLKLMEEAGLVTSGETGRFLGEIISDS